MSTPLYKFDPSRTMYVQFDRRGCVASLNNTSSTGGTVSGYFSDIADFVVLRIYDADDNFGHLFYNKYLPDFDLSNLVLEFDLAFVNCMSPTSLKFPSVPWNSLSYILNDSAGTQGTVPLTISSSVGSVAAKISYAIAGTPVIFDRVQLIYLGNVTFDHIVALGETASDVCTDLVSQINSSTGATNLTANQTGLNTFDIIYNTTGTDGNTVEFIELHKTLTCVINPTGHSKLLGGIDPTSIHITMDFNAIFGSDVTQIRQLYLIIAPSLPIDSSAVNPTLVPFTPIEFSYTLSNISVTGLGNKQLKVANRGSIIVDSRNIWVSHVGTWALVTGFYCKGFAKQSTTNGNTVTINYYSQLASHDLYLGTVLTTSGCSIGVKIDGVSQPDVACYLQAGTLNTRRLIGSSLSVGLHIVELTVKAGITGGYNCYFDFIQACLPSDITNPSISFSKISAALDYDTDQCYKLAPARVLWNLQQQGLLGNIDFYAGVFFAHQRIRFGGFFHSAVCTITSLATYFLTIGGTTFGAANNPADTVDTMAQRFVNGVNALFVGVRAEVTGTGEFTVTTLSTINGFTIAFDGTLTGDILAGNEGIWGIDDSLTNPLNKGFVDFLSDFATLAAAAGIAFTLAFSQELLAPPDVNTSSDAWIQRYSNSDIVLTATGFGSWGLGYVEAVSGSGTITIQQTGHGYLNGYTVHIHGGIFPITVIDTDHYTIVGTASVGDQVIAELQTAQCAFNPLTVTLYMAKVYTQAAAVCAAAGVTNPILQFGEILHWFFDNGTSMALYDANQAAAAIVALGSPLTLFTSPNSNPNVNTYADADFLRQRIEDHIHAIRVSVLASTPTTIFELLYPMDVNWPTVYSNSGYPFNIGGRLNAYINLPPSYFTTGSDIDQIKIECLAWGLSYRTLDNVIVSIKYPLNSPLSWPTSLVSYLQPISNGGCPLVNELIEAINLGIPNLNLFAADHLNLLSIDINTILQNLNISGGE